MPESGCEAAFQGRRDRRRILGAPRSPSSLEPLGGRPFRLSRASCFSMSRAGRDARRHKLETSVRFVQASPQLSLIRPLTQLCHGARGPISAPTVKVEEVVQEHDILRQIAWIGCLLDRGADEISAADLRKAEDMLAGLLTECSEARRPDIYYALYCIRDMLQGPLAKVRALGAALEAVDRLYVQVVTDRVSQSRPHS